MPDTVIVNTGLPLRGTCVICKVIMNVELFNQHKLADDPNDYLVCPQCEYRFDPAYLRRILTGRTGQVK